MGGVILFSLVLWGYSQTIQARINQLNSLLADVSLKVAVDDKTYALEGGKVQERVDDTTKLKVLKLAAFYQWNKEDPLFDSPDFDPGALASSAAHLRDTQKQFIHTFLSSQPLYPVDFLNSFSQAALLQRQFLKNPNPSSAQQLINAQYQAAKLYEQAAQSQLKFISSFRPQVFFSYNIRFGTPVVVSDYKKILDNASALKEEIQRRERCLKQGEGCQRPYFSFPAPQPSVMKPAKFPDFLDKNLVYKAYLDKAGGFPIEGPLSTDTACFGWGEQFSQPLHYFYLGFVPPSVENSYPTVHPFLADDIFFRKIPSNTPLESEKKYKDQGHEYIFQPSDAYYLCPDTGYLDELAETGSFLEHYKGVLAGSGLENLPQGSRAIKSEEEFFKERYPSYEQLDNLADYYGELYKSLAETKTSSSLKEELLQRYLSVKDKLAYFNLLVNNHNLDDRLVKNAKLDPQGVSIAYVYTFRSDYSLFYLLFSPSVWRVSEKPDFIDKQQVVNAISPNGGYISYTQAKKIYTPDQINSWFDDLGPIINQLLK